jgi:hypothetical protein
LVFNSPFGKGKNPAKRFFQSSFREALGFYLLAFACGARSLAKLVLSLLSEREEEKLWFFNSPFGKGKNQSFSSSRSERSERTSFARERAPQAKAKR